LLSFLTLLIGICQKLVAAGQPRLFGVQIRSSRIAQHLHKSGRAGAGSAAKTRHGAKNARPAG